MEETVAKIKGRPYGGSSRKAGMLYHELPFKGMECFPRHRGGTRERIDNIIKIVGSVRGLQVLDLGCSVGGLSLGMLENGADFVMGIDHDPEAIMVARAAAKELGFGKKASFVVSDITIDLIRKLQNFDLIIWMSQWMWSVKQRGLNYGKDLLFEVSRHTKEDLKKGTKMVFETAANDGMAKIKGATQDDIERWLFENTAYERVFRLPSTSGWMNRDIFYCTHPLTRIESTRRAACSIIERIGRDKVKKTFRTIPKDYEWMLPREVEALKRLGPYDHFPKLLEVGENYIVMNFVGRRNQVKFHQMKSQTQDIIKDMRTAGIKQHRDCNKKNFLALNGKLYLIDFGWCVFDGEDINKAKQHKNLPTKTDEELIALLFK